VAVPTVPKCRINDAACERLSWTPVVVPTGCRDLSAIGRQPDQCGNHGGRLRSVGVGWRVLEVSLAALLAASIVSMWR
jgi:hypothetical protein